MATPSRRPAAGALLGYALLGRGRYRSHGRWPGLTAAALLSLVIACIGVTAPGRTLLRGAIGFWPGFAVLRDAQQFIAPLALAEAIGFGLAVAWCVQPRSFGSKECAERSGTPPRSPASSDPLGLALACSPC